MSIINLLNKYPFSKVLKENIFSPDPELDFIVKRELSAFFPDFYHFIMRKALDNNISSDNEFRKLIINSFPQYVADNFDQDPLIRPMMDGLNTIIDIMFSKFKSIDEDIFYDIIFLFRTSAPSIVRHVRYFYKSHYLFPFYSHLDKYAINMQKIYSKHYNFPRILAKTKEENLKLIKNYETNFDNELLLKRFEDNPELYSNENSENVLRRVYDNIDSYSFESINQINNNLSIKNDSDLNRNKDVINRSINISSALKDLNNISNASPFTSLFNDSSLLSSTTVEGWTFIMKTKTDTNQTLLPFVQKIVKPTIEDSPSNKLFVRYESMIGKQLNQFYKECPYFMYFYGHDKGLPSVVSSNAPRSILLTDKPIKDDLDEIEKSYFELIQNAYPLSSYNSTEESLVRERIKSIRINGEPIPNGEEAVSFVFTLAIMASRYLYKKTNFSHNDLHVNNIMVQELSKEVYIPFYDVNGHKLYLKSNIIPKFIDYGHSSIKIDSYLYYNKTAFYGVLPEYQNGYSDMLRLIGDFVNFFPSPTNKFMLPYFQIIMGKYYNSLVIDSLFTSNKYKLLRSTGNRFTYCSLIMQEVALKFSTQKIRILDVSHPAIGYDPDRAYKLIMKGMNVYLEVSKNRPEYGITNYLVPKISNQSIELSPYYSLYNFIISRTSYIPDVDVDKYAISIGNKIIKSSSGEKSWFTSTPFLVKFNENSVISRTTFDEIIKLLPELAMNIRICTSLTFLLLVYYEESSKLTKHNIKTLKTVNSQRIVDKLDEIEDKIWPNTLNQIQKMLNLVSDKRETLRKDYLLLYSYISGLGIWNIKKK